MSNTAQSIGDSCYFFDEAHARRLNRARYGQAVADAFQIAAQTHWSKLRFITPFGFEIFRDESFLSRRLNRFYIYLYAPADLNCNSFLEEQFLDAFLGICYERDRAFADSIAALAGRSGARVLRRRPGHVWHSNDRLIVVEHRKTFRPPLQDYADYLLCCLTAIPSGTLRESSYFFVRSMARFRLFQLGLIAAQALFKACIKVDPLPGNLQQYIRSLRPVVPCYFAPHVIERADDVSVEMLMLLKRYLINSYDVVMESRTAGLTSVAIYPFHGESQLSVTVPDDFYQKFSDEIAETYNQFWLLQA